MPRHHSNSQSASFRQEDAQDTGSCVHSMPEFAGFEVLDNRDEPPGMIIMAVGQCHGVEALQSACPEVRGHDVLTDFQLGFEPWIKRGYAASVHQQRFSVRSD